MKNWATLDEYLTTLCLDRTIGEVVALREKAANVRSFFGAQLIFNAVFEQDIGAIFQIAERIDGAVPTKEKREMFANLVGDALEDVMDMPISERVNINPEDVTIIAIAKVILYISMQSAGSNVQKRKDRQKAIEMVLKRTGGKRTEPVKEAVKLDYVEPEWMQQLPESSE